MKKLTELLGNTGICPALRRIAEASDSNFDEVETGGGGDQPSGGYLTKKQADEAYQPKGNYAPAAPADDPYVKKSEIPAAPDLSGYLKSEVAEETYVAKEEGKGLSTNDYTTEDKKKLDGINVDNIPWRIDIPVRSTQFNKVFAEETILSDWFHVATRADLKSLILKKQLVEVYGITLTYNPHYYRMPVHYAAFESDTQVKLVWVGLDTSNDVVLKYTCIINLDGTVIENGCNVQLTLKAIETE